MRRRLSRSGTRGRRAGASCGSTRPLAPPSRQATHGPPTHAPVAGCSAPSTCASSIDIRRIHIEPYPIVVLSVVHAQRTLREAGGADGGATLMKRRRRVLIKDAALAIIIALALFGAWKLIAWLAGVGVTP